MSEQPSRASKKDAESRKAWRFGRFWELRGYIIIPIVVGAAAIGGMFLFRNYQQAVDNSTWEVFFSVFGIIYAILIGFILLETLRHYHSMESIIHQEFNALEDIHDFLEYIDKNKNVKKEIRRSLHDYTRSVLGTEWDLMASRKRNIPNTASCDSRPAIYGLMGAVHDIKVRNASDWFALEQTINKISEVTTYRTDRMSLSHEHLPAGLRYLMIFMSLVVVVMFALMYVGSVLIHSLMVFSIAAAIAYLCVLIDDLDRPFGGPWQIAKTDFRKFKEKLESEAKLEGELREICCGL